MTTSHSKRTARRLDRMYERAMLNEWWNQSSFKKCLDEAGIAPAEIDRIGKNLKAAIPSIHSQTLQRMGFAKKTKD